MGAPRNAGHKHACTNKRPSPQRRSCLVTLTPFQAANSIPYIDIGVLLDADGRGGIDQISGSVHYLFPGGSSLVSRGAFTPDDIRAAVLYRTEPAAYKVQKEAKYIRGVAEERTAVISVNMFYASLRVNEFLARLHRCRGDPNSDFARTQVSLTQVRMVAESEGMTCLRLAAKVGRGDLSPLLDTPERSVRLGSGGPPLTRLFLRLLEWFTSGRGPRCCVHEVEDLPDALAPLTVYVVGSTVTSGTRRCSARAAVATRCS